MSRRNETFGDDTPGETEEEGGAVFPISRFGVQNEDGGLVFEDDEEDEEVVLTSPMMLDIKELMRRILKTTKTMKESQSAVESYRSSGEANPPAQQNGTPSEENEASRDTALLQENIDVMNRFQRLHHFLWGRILRILKDEYEKGSDAYARSLNAQDRMPFESLAHAVHHNTVFCDELGEFVDASFDRRLENADSLLREQVVALKAHFKALESTQLVATSFALLVVEGTRESYLDPVSMYDLCRTVTNEPIRRKRLVPLSLMFSMLDDDELAVTEALAQGVPRTILQRLRHLVRRLHGALPEWHESEVLTEEERRSPQRYRSAIIHSDPSSRLSSRRGSPQRVAPRDEAQSPMLSSPLTLPSTTPATATETETSDVAAGRELLNSPLPVAPDAGSSGGTFPPVEFGEEGRKRPRTREESPLLQKLRRVEEGRALRFESWQPRVGERVGRGPGWGDYLQGRYCDYGEVLALTSSEEVLVHWVLSEDAPSAARDEFRVFRYRYRPPFCEVVPWNDYLAVKTLTVDKEALRKMEFQLACTVVGHLCLQRETILPALQFQAIESMIHVLDCVDIAESQAAMENASEAAEAKEKARLGAEEEDGAVDEDKLSSFLQWNAVSQCAKQAFREDRETLARVGWVLNGLLSHKKLALLFLDADGVRRVLHIIETPQETSTLYGCCVILANLARTSVFEELLRRQGHYFGPLMHFIVNQWFHSPNADVQGSAGGFLFHSMSFPCVLEYFEKVEGPVLTVDILERWIKSSEERFDVLCPGVQLASLKCLNTYLIAYLMLSTKVVFRKHWVLSDLVTRCSPESSLPRDPATVDAVLGFLTAPAPGFTDVSAESVQSLLTSDRLVGIQKLVGKGFHVLVLRCASFYFIQSRWELLIAALQVLCVLTVVPFVRPLIAEPRLQDSGIAQLLMIVSELSSSFNKSTSSRDSHQLPCAVAALQVLINITTPPMDTSDEAAVAVFNDTCGAFRASDGVRTLLEVLQTRKDDSMSAKLSYFPAIARAVQLMVTLRRYGDTGQLFEALGVHRIAQELLQQYGSVQREYISMMGPRKLHTELDPAGRFMENVKCFLPGAFGEANHPEVVRTHSTDPLEMEQRQTIIGRAAIDYSEGSLLELIAQHLEAEGLAESAQTVRQEGHLPRRIGADAVTTAEPSGMTPTLDAIIRSYLRQQQQRCANPIETLPPFDLTKKHVYVPVASGADQTRNEFNRLLTRKTGAKFTLRAQMNETALSYRFPAFMFDITGGGEGLQGESIAFCDNGDGIIIGTSEGAVAVFDTFPEEATEDKLLEQHLVFENEPVSSLVVSQDGLLVAAVSEGGVARVMSRRGMPVARQEIPGCRTLRFSNDSLWALATCTEQHTCRLYDLRTQQEVRAFTDRTWLGENLDNVAVFDATSQLVLHDAVLWDLRSNDKPIFRFDRITESFASAFHPSNLLVIIDEKVWDLRSLGMIQTVPSFQKTSSFHMSRKGRVIYSFREGTVLTKTANPIVSAVDCASFEPVFSEEVRPPFKTFTVDPSDRYCAAILDQDAESVIRLFSTASGPCPEIGAFASPTVQGEQESDMGDDAEEEEMGEWSMEDDMTGTFDGEDDEMEETSSSRLSYDSAETTTEDHQHEGESDDEEYLEEDEGDFDFGEEEDEELVRSSGEEEGSTRNRHGGSVDST